MYEYKIIKKKFVRQICGYENLISIYSHWFLMNPFSDKNINLKKVLKYFSM